MTSTTVGVVKETLPGERRVALVPDVVVRLRGLGMEVLVEPGAGAAAMFADSAYATAGALITAAPDVYRRADVVACVSPPDGAALHSGQAILGLLQPATRPDLIRGWAAAGITAISLDQLPRTFSRAQPMDALTSQANVTGYKAVLVAANSYGGYFPMLITAAGTARPAAVLVLGAGVAGLQAIGTARRLGAVVTGYDVRPEAREEVTSLGARFLDLGEPVEASGSGGYARELTAAERDAQQRALDERIAEFDIVITAAGLPGRRPPVLVTEMALKAMRPGSVVVDTAAGPLGGNVALSQPDAVVLTGDGVTVVGAGSLPAQMPAAASTAYARNVCATLGYLVHEGGLVIDTGDELQSAIVLCHGGTLFCPAAGETKGEVP
jgi:NAD(P) transhydrogenase subunit alpha